jgi:predicted nuclease with RNAse H fold
VRTLGVDLTSRWWNTAACMIDWQAGRARVEHVEVAVDDQRLIELAESAEKVGLDVPFGWPNAFVAAVAAHHHLKPWPTVENQELRLRRTDLVVWERTGRQPLSVSADKIAMPAFRAARLLSRWGADRTGAGKFVEVFPRAARARFKLDRTRSLDELRGRAPWLDLDWYDALMCEQDEHCFDALIASLVTRASALDLCDPIPESDRESASREGWIALPLADSLERLAAQA